MSFVSIEWLLRQQGGTLSQNDLQTYLKSTSFATRLTKLGSITFAENW